MTASWAVAFIKAGNTSVPVDDASAERSLWLHVILLAQQDAKSGKPQEKRRALKWLTHDNKGLKQVCDLAGLNDQWRCTLIQMEREDRKSVV